MKVGTQEGLEAIGAPDTLNYPHGKVALLHPKVWFTLWGVDPCLRGLGNLQKKED